MSIIIRNLTKYFGKKIVIDNISFTASQGKILGFLGPNGAGKSTTMKMIVGYLKPTSGTIQIETENNPFTIGYLSEHNPLQVTMYVREYLYFIASIYGLNNKKKNKNIEKVINECGLNTVQHTKIETLSKGYRQRVGLAQALLHDPAILILDEPTTGLDPNQLADIRNLIKKISQQKTVILSTHIMQEVEALCQEVVIIHQGKIIVQNTISQLKKQALQQVIVTFKDQISEISLKNLCEVKKITKIGQHSYAVYTYSSQAISEKLFVWAKENEYILIELYRKSNSIETIFQQLTH